MLAIQDVSNVDVDLCLGHDSGTTQRRSGPRGTAPCPTPCSTTTWTHGHTQQEWIGTLPQGTTAQAETLNAT